MGEVTKLVRDADKETKARLKERQQPDRKDIISPVVLEVTGDAANYGCTPLTMTSYEDVEGEKHEDFVWKDAPMITLTDEGKKILSEGGWKAVTDEHIALDDKGQKKARGHSLAVYKWIEHLKEIGEINWSEDAYYFTDEEGQEAEATYMTHVISGEPFTLADGTEVVLKANGRSWKNRFAAKSGVSWEELQAKHPDVYGSKKKEEAKEAEEEIDEVPLTQQQVQAEEQMVVKDDDEEDDDDEFEATAPSAESLSRISEAEVAMAATATVDDMMAVANAAEEDDMGDDHSITKLRLSNFDEAEELKSDSFLWNIGGELVRYYEIELPDIDTVMFLPAGVHQIEGHTYELIEDES